MKLIITYLFFSSCFLSYSQNTISGYITDATTNQALPFVTISYSNTGTTTNENGTFSLKVERFPATLNVSYIGYMSKTITVTNTNTITIALQEDVTSLDQVVVTALGVSRQSRSLGYAVQTLKPKSITEVKTVNFLNNLAGKLAGVSVTQGATGVGSSSKITIRGEASFTNNNPLFVVDGIPINNETVFNVTNEAAAGFQEIDFGNGAMEVNADDIASVTVLKGGSAAALYGARASNGVIVITTKDGSRKKGLAHHKSK